MKRCIAILALLLVSLGVMAQSSHTATLSWNGVAGTITGYKIYRGVCTGTITNGQCSAEATPVIVGSTASDTLTFVDSGLLAGQQWYWYLTAYVETASQTGESNPSNHVAAVIKKDTVPVASPGALTLIVR